MSNIKKVTGYMFVDKENPDNSFFQPTEEKFKNKLVEEVTQWVTDKDIDLDSILEYGNTRGWAIILEIFEDGSVCEKNIDFSLEVEIH